MNKNDHNLSGCTAGFVLYVALLTILTAGAAGGFFIYSAYTQSQAVRRWQAADQCLLDAQSGLERAKYELIESYLTNQVNALNATAWFQTWTSNSIGTNPPYLLPPAAMINDSAVMVRIANVAVNAEAGYADVLLLGAAARATPYPVTRLIQETLRVIAGGGDAQPFNYAYLINNSGSLLGSRFINGDVRANGNFSLANTTYINGNRYASGKITANTRSWTLAQYQSPANTTVRARPTTPTAANAITWIMGYNASVIKARNSGILPIPVISNIDTVAADVSGRISQNNATIVMNVYTGAGPDGIAGTADDHCLILNGSSAPITIQGAVVVKGDLIIRGNVSGQGTIYAGRNIHIVGDLSYANPPAWPKPDPTPYQTAAKNAGKDILVLAAKGNIVVGNYTSAAWSNRVWSILADPKIGSYTVDPSDAVLGYDSDNNLGNGSVFNGQYYANEVNNGRRLSGVGTNTAPRKYYESSLAYSTFNALCDTNNVPTVNAAIFSNHAIIGDWGSSAAGGNTVLNGAMVCHDDLNNYYGSFTINWDIRLGSLSADRINTFFMSVSGAGTGEVSKSSTIAWREIH